MQPKKQTIPFTGYQKIVILLLALTQFTVILDFMVMSPLGDILMKSLNIKPSQFGFAVSSYAFSAGISGLLTAGFADKFDRKKLLMFFYTGFIVGTFLCGIVTTYPLLIGARIVTGLFGGVIASISMAIITDVFPMEQRGRVIGFLQMGFGASQVLGIPIGLFLANFWGWHAPFIWVAVMAAVIAVVITTKMQPITKHLAMQHDRSPLAHLLKVVSKKEYRVGFTATALLSIGGFMMMPFGSAFAINNLGVTQNELPIVFMVAGLSTLVVMPLIGKLSDRFDRYKIFAVATIWLSGMAVIYTNLGVTLFWIVIVLNVLLMSGVMGRMVPSSAMVSGIPAMPERGAFMSINSSLQQIAGGIAAAVGGFIVVQKTKFSPLEHYNTIGYVMVCISAITLILMYRVRTILKRKEGMAKSQTNANVEMKNEVELKAEA